MSKYKLVMFDMDGTLLRDRGIFVIAEKLGFIDELNKMFKYIGIDFYQKSIEIAKLSKGISKKEYLEIFRQVPYSDNTEKVIKELKKNNFKTAIATDSYQILADDLKKRLGLDYAFANKLITNDDIITGELELHNKELKKDFFSGRIYSICKSCVLEQLCDDLNISTDEAIAVGDGRVDIGMIKKAGLGIAYRAPKEVQESADIVADDLSIILKYI
jgi:phosphoserine phosphatase